MEHFGHEYLPMERHTKTDGQVSVLFILRPGHSSHATTVTGTYDAKWGNGRGAFFDAKNNMILGVYSWRDQTDDEKNSASAIAR